MTQRVRARRPLSPPPPDSGSPARLRSVTLVGKACRRTKDGGRAVGWEERSRLARSWGVCGTTTPCLAPCHPLPFPSSSLPPGHGRSRRTSQSGTGGPVRRGWESQHFVSTWRARQGRFLSGGARACVRRRGLRTEGRGRPRIPLSLRADGREWTSPSPSPPGSAWIWEGAQRRPDRARERMDSVSRWPRAGQRAERAGGWPRTQRWIPARHLLRREG